MRRALISIVVAGLVGVWWSRPGPADPPATRVHRAPEPDKRVSVHTPHPPSIPEPARDDGGFAQSASRVADDCGLPLVTRCDDDGCAAVFASPDLDGALGWAQMTAQHPWFVLNVVGRDLGWSATPCGSALTTAFDDGIRAWEPPGRPEVWCSVQAHRSSADPDALCDRVAARVLGLHDADFASSDRRLSFSR